jgi:hypothetical protein
MSVLLKFEAIESRIASYSCSKRASSRVHALRFRRCFRTSTFNLQENTHVSARFAAKETIDAKQGNESIQEDQPQSTYNPLLDPDATRANRLGKLQSRLQTYLSVPKSNETTHTDDGGGDDAPGLAEKGPISLIALHETGGNLDMVHFRPIPTAEGRGMDQDVADPDKLEDTHPPDSLNLYTALEWKYPMGPPEDINSALKSAFWRTSRRAAQILVQDPTPANVFQTIKRIYPNGLPATAYQIIKQICFNGNKAEITEALHARDVSISRSSLTQTDPNSSSTAPNIISDKYFHEYREKHLALIYECVRAQDSHALLYALLRGAAFSRGRGRMEISNVLEMVPAETFSEILRILHPKHFVRRWGSFHMEISRQTAILLGQPDPHKTGYIRFCTRFMAQIHSILQARSKSRLTLADYAFLLKCARETGNARIAEMLMEQMKKDNISPDAGCYNDLLAAKCWIERFNPNLRFPIRVIFFNTARRMLRKGHPYSLAGHLLSNHPLGDGLDIRSSTSNVFKDMVAAGITGNEETFCLMMTALARAGDMPAIESILKRVWGLDVPALLAKDESELPSPKNYPPDSPIHPSSMLLYTIAHIYGINNAVPTALHLVDYISRQYSIQIGHHIWCELLKWTFMLSVPRYLGSLVHEGGRTGHDIGMLPSKAVSNLWGTMTSQPYNIKPSMLMYNYAVKSLIHHKCFGEAQAYILQGVKLHYELVREIRKKRISLQRSHRSFKLRIHSFKDVLSAPQRNLVYAHSNVHRSKLYILGWMKLWSWRGSHSLRYTSPSFANQNIPLMLEQLPLNIPHRLVYRTVHGTVEFRTDAKTAGIRHRKLARAKMWELLGRKWKRQERFEGLGSSWLRHALSKGGALPET